MGKRPSEGVSRAPKSTRATRAKRGKAPFEGVPLRAFYTVTELARAAGMSPYRFARLLEQGGVDFVKSGRVRLVSIADLRDHAHRVWEAIAEVEHIRALHRGD
jgi:hypothetical protein